MRIALFSILMLLVACQAQEANNPYSQYTANLPPLFNASNATVSQNTTANTTVQPAAPAGNGTVSKYLNSGKVGGIWNSGIVAGVRSFLSTIVKGIFGENAWTLIGIAIVVCALVAIGNGVMKGLGWFIVALIILYVLKMVGIG